MVLNRRMLDAETSNRIEIVLMFFFYYFLKSSDVDKMYVISFIYYQRNVLQPINENPFFFVCLFYQNRIEHT